MNWLLIVKDYLEALSYLTILVGLPLAVYQFWRTSRKEALDREYGTYNALDKKYLDFQKVCFDNPTLDIFDIPDAIQKPLSADEGKREIVAFTMLFSIFERAYLMYYDHDTDVKEKQWVGWHDYIVGYSRRGNFQRAWMISGNTFDTDFQRFMEGILRDNP